MLLLEHAADGRPILKSAQPIVFDVGGAQAALVRAAATGALRVSADNVARAAGTIVWTDGAPVLADGVNVSAVAAVPGETGLVRITFETPFLEGQAVPVAHMQGFTVPDSSADVAHVEPGLIEIAGSANGVPTEVPFHFVVTGRLDEPGAAGVGQSAPLAADFSFATRAALRDYLNAVTNAADGTVYFDGRAYFRHRAGASYTDRAGNAGVQAVSDLPDVIPAGTLTPYHFAAVEPGEEDAASRAAVRAGFLEMIEYVAAIGAGRAGKRAAQDQVDIELPPGRWRINSAAGPCVLDLSGLSQVTIWGHGNATVLEGFAIWVRDAAYNVTLRDFALDGSTVDIVDENGNPAPYKIWLEGNSRGCLIDRVMFTGEAPGPNMGDEAPGDILQSALSVGDFADGAGEWTGGTVVASTTPALPAGVTAALSLSAERAFDGAAPRIATDLARRELRFTGRVLAENSAQAALVGIETVRWDGTVDQTQAQVATAGASGWTAFDVTLDVPDDVRSWRPWLGGDGGGASQDIQFADLALIDTSGEASSQFKVIGTRNEVGVMLGNPNDPTRDDKAAGGRMTNCKFYELHTSFWVWDTSDFVAAFNEFESSRWHNVRMRGGGQCKLIGNNIRGAGTDNISHPMGGAINLLFEGWDNDGVVEHAFVANSIAEAAPGHRRYPIARIEEALPDHPGQIRVITLDPHQMPANFQDAGIAGGAYDTAGSVSNRALTIENAAADPNGSREIVLNLPYVADADYTGQAREARPALISRGWDIDIRAHGINRAVQDLRFMNDNVNNAVCHGGFNINGTFRPKETWRLERARGTDGTVATDWPDLIEITLQRGRGLPGGAAITEITGPGATRGWAADGQFRVSGDSWTSAGDIGRGIGAPNTLAGLSAQDTPRRNMALVFSDRIELILGERIKITLRNRNDDADQGELVATSADGTETSIWAG